MLRAIWSHGDSKPQNIPWDGHKYVFLDTLQSDYGAFLYDLVSFLAHLLLAGYGSRCSGIRYCYQRAKEEFLARYVSVSQQVLVAQL